MNHPREVRQAIRCSFSFEEGRNVPMFRTSVDTVPAGRFRGKLVVSMRRFKPADVIRAPGHMLVTDLANSSLAEH